MQKNMAGIPKREMKERNIEKDNPKKQKKVRVFYIKKKTLFLLENIKARIEHCVTRLHYKFSLSNVYERRYLYKRVWEAEHNH